MLELFGIAVVLVSPFAVVTFRRIHRDRAARAAAATGADGSVAPAAPATGTGAVAAGGDEVGAVVARLHAEALEHPTGAWFDLVVPAGATLGGQPADEHLVVRLVVDDLRRSGLEVDPGGSGGRLRCRRT
jgi:hypothetical protein